MRAVDFQNISAQTPGVERAHQNRPQQSEAEQKQYTSIVRETEEQKSKETQSAQESQGTKVQTEKESERKLDLSKKERKKKEEEEKKKKKESSKNPLRGNKIDITI